MPVTDTYPVSTLALMSIVENLLFCPKTEQKLLFLVNAGFGKAHFVQGVGFHQQADL